MLLRQRLRFGDEGFWSGGEKRCQKERGRTVGEMGGSVEGRLESVTGGARTDSAAELRAMVSQAGLCAFFCLF